MTTKKDSKLKVTSKDSTEKIIKFTDQATATNYFIGHSWFIDMVNTESWAYQNSAFTEAEVKQIIETGTNKNTANGINGVVEFKDGTSQLSYIRSDIADNQWIFQRIVGVMKSLNDQFFNYDINYVENVRFLKLENDELGNIEKHTDIKYTSTGTGKLSFALILQPAIAGGELSLHLNSTPTSLPVVTGTMYVYPAYVLREVSPVTEGALYMITGTVVGPRFK